MYEFRRPDRESQHLGDAAFSRAVRKCIGRGKSISMRSLVSAHPRVTGQKLGGVLTELV